MPSMTCLTWPATSENRSAEPPSANHCPSLPFSRLNHLLCFTRGDLQRFGRGQGGGSGDEERAGRNGQGEGESCLRDSRRRP